MTKETGLAAGIGFAVGAVLGSTVFNPRKFGFEKSPEELTEGLDLDPDEIEPEDLDDAEVSNELDKEESK